MYINIDYKNEFEKNVWEIILIYEYKNSTMYLNSYWYFMYSELYNIWLNCDTVTTMIKQLEYVIVKCLQGIVVIDYFIILVHVLPCVFSKIKTLIFICNTIFQHIE